MDWEQHYLDKHTPWDKGAPAPPLMQWLEANPSVLSGDILVPGCGLGHDLRALAENSSGTGDLVGFDISATAVKDAAAYQTVRNETYHLEDLFAPSEKWLGAFDWVFEHNCFCAIDPSMRESYVDAVHRLLKPCGQLLGVFYLNPYDEEHQPGGGPPHGSTVEELKQRFIESGKFDLVEEHEPAAAYPGREGLEWVMRLRRSS